MKINQIKNIIEKNPVALATVKTGKAYVIATAFAKIKDGKIVITDNYMKITTSNIKKNPNISLAVWNKKWEGYQINGKAEYFDKGKWQNFVKSLKENKGLPAKGAIVIKIKNIKRLA